MGRPIKKSFFGNTNSPYNNFASGGGTGLGGEGIASIAVVTVNGTGTGFTTGTVVTISGIAGGSQLPGGTPATGIIYTGTGTSLKGITITNPGTGFISTGSFAYVYASGGTTGTGAVLVPTLTANSSTNSIIAYAYVRGASSTSLADIKKQESDHNYLVTTKDGTGVCSLATTSTLAAGQMYILATDASGNTYFVQKLTARKALLYPFTVTNVATVYGSGVYAPWTINGATGAYVSIGHTV